MIGVSQPDGFDTLRCAIAREFRSPMEPVRNRSRLGRCAVLFVDLRGYTTLCEDLAPSAVAILLDEFYAVIGDAIGHAGGKIQNLAGDAVMAVFGLEEPTPGGDGRAAVESGRRMIAAFQAVGDRWEQLHGVTTGIGVGVHVGAVMESDLGPPTLRRPTLVGDTVNVAARLCHRARAGEVNGFDHQRIARLECDCGFHFHA